MRTVPFFKFSPGGNTTLLFPDTGLSPKEKNCLVSETLSPLHLYAEQAGFVHLSERRMEMAGGEFCCNATRAFGALLALEVLPQHFSRQHLEVTVSGTTAPVTLELRRTEDPWCIHVTARLPLLPPPVCSLLEPGIILVRLPGISHLLLDGSRYSFPEDWQNAAREWWMRFGLHQEAAAGCIWWSGKGTRFNAIPVVQVTAPYSLCRESSCGSGSMALALALRHTGIIPATEEGISVMQPSGIPLELRFGVSSQGKYIAVGGPVRLLARGETFFTYQDHL